MPRVILFCRLLLDTVVRAMHGIAPTYPGVITGDARHRPYASWGHNRRCTASPLRILWS
jgi:hypothetical protein